MLFQFWALANVALDPRPNVAFDPSQRCVDITKLRRKFGARRTHLQTAVRVRSSCVCFVYKYTHIALSDKPFRIIDRFNKVDSAGVALRARFFTRNVKMATI